MKNTNTIFFIEDERPLVESFSAFLRDKGYLIESASNGREAMERLPIVKPDLILLDIIMPDMDGISFLKQIRKPDSPNLHTKVLIFTNLVGEKQWINQMGLEITDYIVKANSSLADLVARLKKILGV